MDFLNNNDASKIPSYTSWETPQYNKPLSIEKGKTLVKFSPFYAQKSLTKEVNDNATAIVKVSKKIEVDGEEKASLYIYGNKKDGLLHNIAEVLAEIVAGKDAHSVVSITHLKSELKLYEDIDLEFGKY